MIPISRKVVNSGMELYTFVSIDPDGISPANTTVDASTGEVISTDAVGVLFSGELENNGTLKQGTIADIIVVGVCPVKLGRARNIEPGDIVVPEPKGNGYAAKSNTTVGFVVERVEGNYAYVIIR